jgi:hypothetical protein
MNASCNHATLKNSFWNSRRLNVGRWDWQDFSASSHCWLKLTDMEYRMDSRRWRQLQFVSDLANFLQDLELSKIFEE